MTSRPILLVEDNSDDEYLALRTLRKMGFENVSVAHDGQEAVDVLLGDEQTGLRPSEPPPALVLLDLRLPKFDGLEVLNRLRHAERTMYLPVYILTSSEDPHDREACLRLGARAILSKPLTVAAFAAVAGMPQAGGQGH